MDDLTEDQIVSLGHFCEYLREQPLWNQLLKTFELQIVSHMMSTEPHEAKKREGIYASCLGVRDLQAHMNAFVEEKKKLTEQPTTAPSEYDAQPMDMD